MIVSYIVCFSLLQIQTLRIIVEFCQVVRMAVDDNDKSRKISIAKDFVISKLGVGAPDILAKNFVSSAPDFTDLDKTSYIEEKIKEYAAFQRAVPDFDWQAYDYDVDETDQSTIQFKLRPTGTVTGPYSYKGTCLIVYIHMQINWLTAILCIYVNLDLTFK